MITLKKVLVPTDFSEASKVAIKYARNFASAYHGSVHVLHVLPDASVQPWAFGVEPEVMGLPSAEREKRWKERAAEQMKQLFSEAERKDLELHLTTVVGHPVQQILQYATEQGVDLIVMGTHGRSTEGPNIGQAFPWNPPIGSVAERVVRGAPCPVLSVRHPEHEFVTP